MEDTLNGKLAFSKTESTDISVLPARLLRRPHVLQIVAGEEINRTIPLGAGRLTVGRSNEADVCIMSADLSRMHIRIEGTRTGYRVVDLDSRNGVYLNEVRIHSAELRDGDSLQLGNVLMVYHEGS